MPRHISGPILPSTLPPFERLLKNGTLYVAIEKERDDMQLALRQRDPNSLDYVPHFRVPQVSLAPKPQNFDTSGMPLFGDGHKQGEMF